MVGPTQALENELPRRKHRHKKKKPVVHPDATADEFMP